MKVVTRLLGALLGVILLFLFVIYVVSEIKLRSSFQVEGHDVAVLTDSAALAHGKYLSTAIGKCVDCHGADLGGAVMFSDPAIGTVIGPNLTSGEGSVINDYTIPDWERAIRHGVGPDGSGLAIMPSNEYYFMSDRELGSLLGYLQSIPPVNRTMEKSSYGPMGRALYVFGVLPVYKAEKINHTADRGPEPTPGITKGYGEHLARIGGCNGCHGNDLAGGPIPGVPPDFLPASNITLHADGIAGYDLAKFRRALKQGKRKDGGTLDPKQMPWNSTTLMTEADIEALWAYVSSMPATESTWD